MYATTLDPNRHIVRAIPAGVTATAAWRGLAAYESAPGEARPMSAITQRPIGVIVQIDPDAGYLVICRKGHCFAKPGAGVDLSDQLAAYGSKACGLVDGRVGTPAATSFFLGDWDTKGGSDPTEVAVGTDGDLHPFFVDIADTAIPEA